MFKKSTERFAQLSLRDKLLLTSMFSVLVLLVMLVCINLVWRHVLVEQTHESAYKDIHELAQRTSEKLQSVDYLSYRVLDEPLVQSELGALADGTKQADIQARRLNTTINDTVRDTSIVSNTLLFDVHHNSLVNFIPSRDKIMDDLSLKTILAALPNKPGSGRWFFNSTMRQGVYARRLFATQNFSLRYIGTVVFIVDTSFLNETMQATSLYSDENLYFFRYRGQNYSPMKQTAALKYFERRNETLEANYHTQNYEGTMYYTAIDHLGDFDFVYMVPENRLLHRINQIQMVLLAVMMVVALGIFVMLFRMSRQITEPITQLADRMRVIRGTQDIKSLRPIDYSGSDGDEIAVLYHSYNLMIKEVDHLIKDNYEMKILSQEIEFTSLSAQLDPHFLYNTLDSINWLAIANDQPQIATMVTSLAHVFRKKIDSRSEWSTIQDELELIHAYLVIQKIRFDSRIKYVEHVDVADLQLKIPKLTIQPLIENVFKYAVNDVATQIILTLDVRLDQSGLQVQVSDNGPGFKLGFKLEESTGIGLRNINDRLRLHYGPEAFLDIPRSDPYETTTVRWRIPKAKLEESS